MGVLSDGLALAYTSGVREELFLEVLGDPLFDDEVVFVVLCPY
jgi:hypothetical protein